MNYRKKLSHINKFSFNQENGERGSTLVVVLIFTAIMFAIAVGAITMTQLNVTASGAHKKEKQAFYAAEAGLDWAVNQIVQTFEGFSVYSTTAIMEGGNPGVTFPDYEGHEVYYTITNPLDRYLYRTIVGNGTVFHFAYTFDIESRASSLTDNSKETLNETIRILETPLVQYFAFYAGAGDLADLELYPGAGMTIWGRMHANGHMYMTGRNYGNIYIRNFDLANQFAPHFVSMGGEFRGDQKHDTATWGDTDVLIRTNNNNTIIGTGSSEYREVPLLVDSANEATEEANFNDFLLVNENTHQAPTQEQFWRGGFYEIKAENPQNSRIDSMVISGTGNSITVSVSRPAANTDVTSLIMDTPFADFASGGNMTRNPIEDSQFTTGNNTLNDGRENKWLDFTDIDLNLLQIWYQDYLATNGLTWAGDGMLIYVSRSPRTTTPPTPPVAWANSGSRLQAIRLRTRFGSSPTLLEKTTVATDNPIYIEGNFNTINTKGVALISDATNILSENFSTKCNGCLPNAANTTVNAAFFSGIKPNQVNSTRVGGGLHNYPRLHEYWGNSRTLTINGSFISLWASTQATGNWCHSSGGDCYYRPSRAYGWDINFLDPTYWPPFIPSIFSVERVGFLE